MAGIPIYMRIRQYVNDLMLDHADSDVRIMSERELCKKFNVTRPTARMALKELIDEGCLYIKPGLGTFINSAKVLNNTFALRKSYKVMVLFGSGRSTDMSGFSMDILARICNRLKDKPIRLQIVNLNSNDSNGALEELQMYNPDGIIWIKPSDKCMRLISTVRQRIPVYIVGNVADGSSKFHVTMDYYQGGRLAANWFLERKRRNVLFVGYAPESKIKSEVFRGWQDEFAVSRIDFDNHLCVDMSCNIINQTEKLLTEKALDGIFTFGSEFIAVDIALEKAGIDGGNFPVVFDENYFATYGAKTAPAAKLILFSPEVTELAADNLFKTLENPEFEQEEIVLPVRIESLGTS
jgi:DNA-binding LacI/PurR family transcriptional regulator